MTAYDLVGLCKRSHEISKDKGWVVEGEPRPFHTAFILMVSEVSEALEEYRNNRLLETVYYEVSASGHGPHMVMSPVEADEVKKKNPKAICKPCGIPIELADLVIRICQWCGTEGEEQVLQDDFNSVLGEYYANGIPFEEFLADITVLLSESYSVGNDPDFNDPHGAVSYLADVVSATFSFCNENGIFLWAAIEEKEKFNKTRSHRHGGKKC